MRASKALRGAAPASQALNHPGQSTARPRAMTLLPGELLLPLPGCDKASFPASWEGWELGSAPLTCTGEGAELGIRSMGSVHRGICLPWDASCGRGPGRGIWEDEEHWVLLWVLRIQDPALPGAPWCCRMS